MMLRLLIAMVCLAQPLRAEAPRVVTDIVPVHALVSMVMGKVGTPDYVVRPGSSPHHHAMRPSEARLLANADVVIWVGHSLTPWLEAPIDSLAGDALVLSLMETKGLQLLPYREGAMFEGHDHGAHEDHEHHKGHDDHEDHEGHDDHEAHEGHDDHEAHEEHDGHDDHEGHADEHKAHVGHDEAFLLDPHVWLGPQNAEVFLNKVSVLLSEVDPENATVYARNAEAAQARIRGLVAEIEADLAPLRGTPFIVLHDGFHYFEAYFEIEAIGAISAGDAQSPGAARLQRLRETLQDSGVRCAFSEPGVGTALIETATEGLEIRFGTLDPVGATLTPGPDLYLNLIRAMADNMITCLSSS